MPQPTRLVSGMSLWQQPEEQQEEQQDPAAPTAAAPGATTPGQQSKETPPSDTDEPEGEEKDYSKLPKWAQDKIRELGSESKKYRQAKAKAEDDAKKKSDDDLVAQQKWQQLAETRGAELATLKAKNAELEELTERITGSINAEIKDWPEEVKSLAPDGEVSAKAMLDWVDKARPIVAKLKGKGQSQTPPPGNSRGPDAAAQAANNQGNSSQQQNNQSQVQIEPVIPPRRF